MNTYIVTYIENYPGADEKSEEDLTKTAFVLADSFDEAKRKVEKRFEKEYESVSVRAICIDNKAHIII